MGSSMAIMLVLFVLFTITSTSVMKNALADDETYSEGSPSWISADDESMHLTQQHKHTRHKHKHISPRQEEDQPDGNTYEERSPSWNSAGDESIHLPKQHKLHKGHKHEIARPIEDESKPQSGMAENSDGSGSWDAVVAKDGSGNYQTIKEALAASLDSRKDGCFAIRIKAGTYEECLVVEKNMKHITLIGDGIGKTIITGSHSVNGGYKTWKAATVLVLGDGFVAIDITFQNTAGSQNSQAPAITTMSPHSAFFRCSFEGYQDTVYAHQGLQFYRECDIYGTIDFICGDAAVVIQNSNIYTRKSEMGKAIVIAASSRDSQDSPTGIVFHNCRVMAAPDLKPVVDSYKISLGRPWRPYARTVYISSEFDIPVVPEGWSEWEGGPSNAKNTVDYREYGNMGLGSSTDGRVTWPGYRAITDSREAEQYTVANFIQGDKWLPSTGVPYTAGL